MQNDFLEQSLEAITDTNVTAFDNKIKYLHKKRFCDELLQNTLISDVCNVFNKWLNHQNMKENLNDDELFCIYMKQKYNGLGISEILLSSLDDITELQEIRADRAEKEINSQQFIKYVFANNNINNNLDTILNDFLDQLQQGDVTMLQFCCKILDKMKNETIAAGDICDIFGDLGIKVKNKDLEIRKSQIYQNQQDMNDINICDDLLFLMFVKMRCDLYENTLNEILPNLYKMSDDDININIDGKQFLKRMLQNRLDLSANLDLLYDEFCHTKV